jgi:Protein of unknown function (DUF3486)
VPSKLETSLTPEQVVELLETLAKTPGGVILREIQAAAKLRGIEISLPSASNFRDKALEPYLQKLKHAREKSLALAEAVTEGDESGLLTSARTLLAERINDLLLADDYEQGEKEFLALSKALSGLSSSNQGDRMTRARLRELEAKELDRKKQAELLEGRKTALLEKGGISAEAIRLFEDAVKILG